MIKRYFTALGCILLLVAIIALIAGPVIAAVIVVRLTANALFWLIALGELITFPLGVAIIMEND